jgi:predicted RNA binding protein YcfA (HicA-like mRNA interferase family)
MAGGEEVEGGGKGKGRCLMPRLPRDLSGYEVRKAFERVGFRFVRRRGSHCILERGEDVLSVPDHRVVKPGTLRQLIRDAGLTVSEFRALL